MSGNKGKTGAAEPSNPPASNLRSTAAKSPAAAGSSSGAAAASSSGAGGQEGKASDEDAEAAGPEDAEAPQASGSDGAAVAKMFQRMQAMEEELNKLRQQQQPPQQQSLSLDASSSSPPPSSDIAALIRAMHESSVQQAEQMLKQQELARKQQEAAAELARKQQAASAAQLLILQSLGDLPTFNGKGADTTLIAQEWLQRAEDFFTAREQAVATDAAQADKARLTSAATALQDDARRWYTALPQRPTTWTEFCDAVKARFCSVPSERIRVDKLTEFIEKAARLRDKLNVQGMQAFTARFAQLAGEVPDEYLTQHHKLALLARGLPQRYAEVVLQEDAKKPLPLLHQVINTVLGRAANKEQAASYGGSSSSPASAAPINIDSISMAVATFGWTREEAQSNLCDSEGWAPYDTHGGSQLQQGGAGAGPASKASPSPTSSSDDKLDRILSALATHAKVGAGPAARDRNSRRNPPSGVTKDIPPDLVKARQEADLCIKCGVVKYEPGGKGHNSRTCKAAADKTTSVAEGRKKAGF
jgi:hypothetical protein